MPTVVSPSPSSPCASVQAASSSRAANHGRGQHGQAAAAHGVGQHLAREPWLPHKRLRLVCHGKISSVMRLSLCYNSITYSEREKKAIFCKKKRAAGSMPAPGSRECGGFGMKIGNTELNGRVILAPMAGVTDSAFRAVCARFGAAAVVTEMVSAKAPALQGQAHPGADAAARGGAPRGHPALPAASRRSWRRRRALPGLRPGFHRPQLGCPMPKIVNNGQRQPLS